MRIADRIARLEQHMKDRTIKPDDASLPIFRISLDDGDKASPYSVSFKGVTWTQKADETLAALQDRSLAGALALWTPADRGSAMFLVAMRPRSADSP